MNASKHENSYLLEQESSRFLGSAAFILTGVLPSFKSIQRAAEEKESVRLLDTQPNELLYALVTYTITKEIPNPASIVGSVTPHNGVVSEEYASRAVSTHAAEMSAAVKDVRNATTLYPSCYEEEKKISIKDSTLPLRGYVHSKSYPNLEIRNRNPSFSFDDADSPTSNFTDLLKDFTASEVVSSLSNAFDRVHADATPLYPFLSCDACSIDNASNYQDCTSRNEETGTNHFELVSTLSKSRNMSWSDTAETIPGRKCTKFEAMKEQNSKYNFSTASFNGFDVLTESPVILGDFNNGIDMENDAENFFDSQNIKSALQKEEETMYGIGESLSLYPFTMDKVNTSTKEKLVGPIGTSLIVEEDSIDIAVYSVLKNSLFVFTWNSIEKELKQKFLLECVTRGYDEITAIEWVGYTKSDLPYMCVGQRSGAFCIYHQNCRGTLQGDFEKEIRSIRYDDEQGLILFLLAGSNLAVIPLSCVELSFQTRFESIFPPGFLKSCIYNIPRSGTLNDMLLLKERYVMTSAYTFASQIEEDAGIFKSTARNSSSNASEHSFGKKNQSLALEESIYPTTLGYSETLNSKVYPVNTRENVATMHASHEGHNGVLNSCKELSDKWRHRLLLLVGDNPVLSLIIAAEISVPSHFLQETEEMSLFDKNYMGKATRVVGCMPPLFQRLFNVDSAGLLQSEVEKCGLWEGKRKGIRVIECPWKGNVILVLDNLGQISLASADMLVTLHVWKGYREADAAWLVYTKNENSDNFSSPGVFPTLSSPSASSRGGIVIYTHRRSLLELWDASSFVRLFAFSCTISGHLLQYNGNVFFAGTSGHIHKIEWKINVL
ncbi:hypothetical protein IE077_000670 [Cardiosporidium cionae]|uniref:Rab3-GAP regulatory subunit N-terminal domain-containing protein n=1 Tax=Cardiosporidium cionae TaxID=476202 RepID=A0ABQ7JE71_9APIC|nr:hypothetical protein IE077_000670 [Cardiosporidium cionae]|eukprot:KAF8822286.1 hypothetical protein IE077_000670 [Cardiosporidium cionae]